MNIWFLWHIATGFLWQNRRKEFSGEQSACTPKYVNDFLKHIMMLWSDVFGIMMRVNTELLFSHIEGQNKNIFIAFYTIWAISFVYKFPVMK